MLGISLAVKPGDPAFYPLTAALAAVWVIGGFASGPLHLGRIAIGGRLRRPVITPIAIGLIASAIFVVGALVVREIGPLADYTQSVLEHARKGSLPLLVLITVGNGITEEVFFRGALYAAIGVRHPVPITTVVYAIATVASGNPMLVFAALTLGLVLALQRRASGGLLAPILTHITWSTGDAVPAAADLRQPLADGGRCLGGAGVDLLVHVTVSAQQRGGRPDQRHRDGQAEHDDQAVVERLGDQLREELACRSGCRRSAATAWTAHPARPATGSGCRRGMRRTGCRPAAGCRSGWPAGGDAVRLQAVAQRVRAGSRPGRRSSGRRTPRWTRTIRS